ncbi:hypothetical protein AVEN_39940-1, partial [Araneus ventricosus]
GVARVKDIQVSPRLLAPLHALSLPCCSKLLSPFRRKKRLEKEKRAEL